ncbi:hypothetical protein [Sphingobium sp. WCS2017Hpa-17]|uniref:hypothetical protein n=1 Tax=Sphingobium sp. WCS2017Hpa-17 TaxID=3073638 RepID=UPI0028896BBE|nr:hypothetical protein [Sphingobium sp. WCS2017Hpa-17]
MPRTLPTERLSGPGRIAREKLAPVMTEAWKGYAALHCLILFDPADTVKKPLRPALYGQLSTRFSAIVSQ